MLRSSPPPAIPTGLVGKFITKKRVQLNWDANTEEDLQGYRLFVSNGLASNYTQITKAAVIGEQFIYDVDPTFMVDKIYFKILSTDKRDNYSEKSAAIELERPDIIPPASPVLYKVSPTPAGVAIGFQFSSSEDRVRHELERKRKGAPGWETILSIDKNEEASYAENLTPDNTTATTYQDTAILERRAYQYRLMAYDDDGNVFSSEVIAIRPYDSGLRGIIKDFKLYTECVPTGDITKPQAFNTLEWLLKNYELEGTIDLDSLQALVVWNVISNGIYTDLVATINSGQDAY
ncbi:MAG: hypothetical protein AAF573_22185, partial [Bacteroidota bacterium]